MKKYYYHSLSSICKYDYMIIIISCLVKNMLTKVSFKKKQKI